MSRAETIAVHREGAIAVVTLVRPEVLNALNHALRDDLAKTLGALNADEAVRAVVITGSGERAFCVGLDMGVSTSLDADNVEDWLLGLKDYFTAMRAMDKPTVAAMNGIASGLGLQTALHCDVRVGHPGVRVSQPEIDVGVPSVLGLRIIGELIGLSRTIEMSLRCRTVDAEECLAWGLLHELVERDRVVQRAMEVAGELAGRPPVAMRLSKQRMREISQAAFDDAFEAAIRMQKEGYASGEPQALAQAFLERRRRS